MSTFSPGRMNVVCQVVKGLIQQAYDQNATGKGKVGRLVPIKGGPAWIDTERYSIEAKAESPESQAMMMGPMLRKILEDRFKLVIHRETPEVPVYLLTLTRVSRNYSPLRKEPAPSEISRISAAPSGARHMPCLCRREGAKCVVGR